MRLFLILAKQDWLVPCVQRMDCYAGMMSVNIEIMGVAQYWLCNAYSTVKGLGKLEVGSNNRLQQ